MSKKGIEDLKKEYKDIHMSEQQVDAFRKSIELAKKENRKIKKMRIWKVVSAAVAAVMITFIVLPNTSASVAYAMGQIPVLGNVVRVVTFRDYSYEGETQIADIDVPELEIETVPEEGNDVMPIDANTEEIPVYDGGTSLEESTKTTLEDAVNGINRDIDTLTSEIIREFEKSLREEGYVKEVIVSHETVKTPEQYFTLKLTHYEAVADGAELVYYYTIDLITGERLALKDLFMEEADYIGIISKEIIRQMREQMAADENVWYWLDEEMEEWNFKTITDETQFYINENNHLVISFNEGDVAPMYMGVVTFEIPEEVLAEIRK